MKLTAPTTPVWIIAVILGVLGLLGGLAVVPQLAGYAFWLMTIAFVLLALATLLKGM